MILVTGATGLVGQEVLRILAATGQGTAALVRDRTGANFVESLGATPLFGAVEEADTWRQPLPPLSGVVHAAAIIAERAGWDRFEAVNVDGTRHACRLAEDRHVPLVHISSVAVYGRRAADDAPYTIREAYPPGVLPAWEYYARSKRMAEQVVFEHADRGLRACSLRPDVIYGPGDRLLLPRLLSTARRGWFPLVGDGRTPMALVHATSVAQAVLAAFTSDRGWGRAFNVTGDAPVTARDILAAVATFIGRPPRAVRLPAAPALAAAGAAERLLRLLGRKRYPGSLKGAVRFLRGGDPYDSSSARNVLRWRPAVDPPVALVQAFRSVANRG